MPYKSAKQSRYLHAEAPEIAEAWDQGKSSVTGKKERGTKALNSVGKPAPKNIKGKALRGKKK